MTSPKTNKMAVEPNSVSGGSVAPQRSSLARYTPTLITFLILFLSTLLTTTWAGPAEDRLIANKLKGYNPLARPVEGSDAVTLYFGMGLIQILQIIEVEQTMKINVWLRMIWSDSRLSWDADEYDGVPNIRLPFDSVWNPEIVLFNNANGVYEVNYKSNVVVYPDGTILWVPPALFVSTCSIDVRYFPFDEQICEMTFGSWTYNSEQVSMAWYDGWPGEPFAVMTDYVRSGSWDITIAPGIIKTDPHRKVTNTIFYLHLRRKTLFFIINLIIPCVVIAVLCWFTFILPSTSGEKVGYAITLLLGLMVFLLLLFTVLPATSETVPLMAQFLLFIYIFNVVTIILCVWIIGYSFRLPSTHLMTERVRSLFLEKIPPWIGMKRPSQDPHIHEPQHDLDESLKIEASKAKAAAESNGMSRSANSLDNAGPPFGAASRFDHLKNELIRRKFGAGAVSDATTVSAITAAEPLSEDVIQAAKDVRFIAERASGNNEDGQVEADWKYVGLVLDSLTFLVTGILVIGGTCFFLMTAPNSFGGVDQHDLMDNWAALHCRTFWTGDYSLYSHDTADPVTIDTMKSLCCAKFFSTEYLNKTSKYSNETASPTELGRMEAVCNDKSRKRRSMATTSLLEYEDEVDTETFSPGTRAGGPMRARQGKSGKDKEKMDNNNSNENSDNHHSFMPESKVNWTERFASMGLDFEVEWREALRENLFMMRNGERDFKKVENLMKQPVRKGMDNRAVKMG